MQAETKRIYSIMYSERFENRATVQGRRAGQGRRHRPAWSRRWASGRTASASTTRPAWFFDKARYGGILCDIASHQADQFLYFTGSTRAEVVAAQVGNVQPPAVPELRGLRRRDAARRRRHRLHPRGLVHAGRAAHLGRRPADDPGHRRLHRDPQEHRHRRRAPARATSSSWTRRRRATSTAAGGRSCPTARSSWTTSSTAPRPRCRRRTASWPRSSPCGRRRTPRRCGSRRSRHGGHTRKREAPRSGTQVTQVVQCSGSLAWKVRLGPSLHRRLQAITRCGPTTIRWMRIPCRRAHPQGTPAPYGRSLTAGRTP